MSTTTSVFGMLPLVLFPGAGSELYRGLGSVVLGGLSLSAILTLAIIPPLMALFCAAVERNRGERLERKAAKDVDDNKDHTPAIDDQASDAKAHNAPRRAELPDDKTTTAE